MATLVALAAATSARGAPGIAPLARVLTARFTLEASGGGGRAEGSGGHLSILPDGSVCVVVERPIRQNMLLAPGRIQIHYPDQDLLLRGEVRARQVPPVLDGVLAGIGDPARRLPADASILERTTEAGILTTLWRAGASPAADRVRIVETREGARSVEVLSAGGRLRRRYEFGDRVRAGSLAVPRAIQADYRDGDGAPSRIERWTLADVAEGASAGAAEAGCDPNPRAREVRELSW